MTTSPAAAKYILTKEPPLPSTCSGCGKSADGKNKFVDFNLSIDYYGAIVFCYDCSREISNLIGFISERERDLALDELSEAVAENRALKEKIESLENVVRAYLPESISVDSPSEPDSPFNLFEEPDPDSESDAPKRSGIFS